MWHKLFGIKAISLLGLGLLTALIFALVAFTMQNYQQLAKRSLQQSAGDLLRLKSKQHLEILYDRQKQFAYRLQSEQPFRTALQQDDVNRLQYWLQLALERSQSRSKLMRIRSILLRDLDGEIIAVSHQDNSATYNGCPLVIDRLKSSSGTQRLKAKYGLCNDENTPMAEVVVAVGSLKPRAYLHVIAYLQDQFIGLQDEIEMPIKLQNVANDVLHQSAGWDQLAMQSSDYLVVSYTLYGDDNVAGITLSALQDISLFNQQIEAVDFNILTVVSTSTISLLLLLAALLLYAFRPVENIRKSVGLMFNGGYAPINQAHLPHELREFVSAYNEMVIGFEDASQKQQEAELELRRERDFISTTLDSITNAVIVIDSTMQIQLANPAAEAMLGDDEETLKDYALDELVIMYTNRSATHIANLKQLLKSPHQLINLFFQRDGATIELEMMASPMVDKETEAVGHVLIFKDVTEDRKLRRKLHLEGLHDPLTGLLNRRSFENRFDAMINEAEVTHCQHIMVYINLDQFKLVNDSGGSEAGDELLKQVAKLIQNNVRKSDALARLGGDEFGILFPYARTDIAERSVKEMLRLILQQGFSWQERQFHISASAALVEFGHSTDDFAQKYNQLITVAKQAKENGGNQCYLAGN